MLDESSQQITPQTQLLNAGANGEGVKTDRPAFNLVPKVKTKVITRWQPPAPRKQAITVCNESIMTQSREKVGQQDRNFAIRIRGRASVVESLARPLGKMCCDSIESTNAETFANFGAIFDLSHTSVFS